LPGPSGGATQPHAALSKVSNPLLEKVKVEELIDEQILRRLDKTGFIDATYTKYGVK
jgi:hypothetical protein